ncbi:class I SAM-dependent methyltransferase [Roseibium aggregatum]|uniref:Class I SAM-dependent methyltransferase n=1 Tax=Roseibium aggregatum TaxID=187304 RepID=A0A939EGV3_9HYPH|nr:class I SAM-dependent methyltransferase [Roseibium aggregatum]MBN9672738.1 class I SAM-dependent methyltransferase [Roseibium aggregatum]
MQTATRKKFWNDHYRKGSSTSSGRPGTALAQFTAPLTPGTVLELGCAKGDDAIWLARRGWQVTAVDVSSVALDLAAKNARQAGVSENLRFEEHDLAVSFPQGSFDLVTASFLHAPQDWPRAKVLRQAADAVDTGGHLLIVDHGSRAPWSWAPEDTVYPTAEDTLASLELVESTWQRCCVCPISRMTTGPEGQSAIVTDTIIFLRHLN